jgi:hypothetical protein
MCFSIGVWLGFGVRFRDESGPDKRFFHFFENIFERRRGLSCHLPFPKLAAHPVPNNPASGFSGFFRRSCQQHRKTSAIFANGGRGAEISVRIAREKGNHQAASKLARFVRKHESDREGARRNIDFFV